ncbi:hypothetical protein FBZ98_11645 [Rhizobium sp. ERR 922]|nr:hypothetical protein FBZ98_11645 [Rhizobium sp. ERR 922]
MIAKGPTLMKMALCLRHNTCNALWLGCTGSLADDAADQPAWKDGRPILRGDRFAGSGDIVAERGPR